MNTALTLKQDDLVKLIIETYQEVKKQKNPQEYLGKLRAKAGPRPEGMGEPLEERLEKKGVSEQTLYTNALDHQWFDTDKQKVSDYKRAKKIANGDVVNYSYTNDHGTTINTKNEGNVANAINSEQDSFWNYHLLLDIVAAILYIVGGIAVGTIMGAPIGLVLEALAILVELVNVFTWIYDDEDYFMAGLTASFIIFPVGNILAKTLFKPLLNVLRAGFNTVFKKVALASSKGLTIGKMAAGEIIELFGKTVSRKVGAIVRKNPVILDALIGASNKCKQMYFGIKSLIKYCKETGWGMQSLIPVLRFIKNYVFKIIWKCIKVVLMVVGEMSLYDPDFTGGLLDILGFDSVADWLHAQPKLLLSFHNSLLDMVGNKRGVMTTTPYDCRRSVYNWDEIVTEFKGKFGEDRGDKIMGPTEGEIWDKWVTGWRPGGGSQASVIFTVMSETPALVKEYPKVFQDCYKFTKLYESANQGNETDMKAFAEITAFWKENK